MKVSLEKGDGYSKSITCDNVILSKDGKLSTKTKDVITEIGKFHDFASITIGVSRSAPKPKGAK